MGEQPDVGAGRQIYFRPAAFRRSRDRSVPANLDVPPQRIGDGLQVTEKNGLQKDAGEPAISADGTTSSTAATLRRGRHLNTTRIRTAPSTRLSSATSRPGMSGA